MQRHTIRRHLLRNIIEINLALNMLELHVIPERPVTTGSLDGCCF